jgi:hypothetical protein
MIRHRTVKSSQLTEINEDEWGAFSGGELEGRRPKAMCLACREAFRHRATLLGSPTRGPGRPAPRTSLCFECYRADLARERALKAARDLDTASEPRFQSSLPFDPVNRLRLERLRAERAAARAAMHAGVGRFVDKRRHAQIAARHALQRIAAGLQSRGAAKQEIDQRMASAIHAAELQLPDAWLPFVVSR